MYTVNTRGSVSPATNTREAARSECIELLRSYGVGSRDDLLRVVTLLRNGGNIEMAKQLTLCWAIFEREKMK